MAEGQNIFNAKVIDTETVLARESDRELIQEWMAQFFFFCQFFLIYLVSK